MEEEFRSRDLSRQILNQGGFMSKIWIWSAAGLLVINLVIVGIVAFLIHRDSTQSDHHAQSLIGNKVVTLDW